MSFITYQGCNLETMIHLAIMVLLLFVSAMASASEVAFFSLSPADIRRIHNLRSVRSESTIRLLKRPEYLLATILVVNNLVNIGIVILSASIIDSLFLFTRFEFLFTGIVATFILLLFGEILPKVIAQGSNLRIALMCGQTLTILGWIVYPLSYILLRTGNRIGEFTQHNQDISIEDLADAVDMAKAGSKEEHKMLSGIVNFAQREVEEIMHSRIDIVAIESKSSFSEVKQTIIESGYSRIPVYEEDLDHIIGTLYVKDLLQYISEGDGFRWLDICRKPYFVPLHKKINTLLTDFQTDKVHMAIVVDEFGATQGLVSLEDILEEVVGEISDESDNEESFYRRLNENTYLFEGKTHIVDMLRVLQLDDSMFEDVQGRAETIAGLLLEINGNFLKKDDEIVAHNIRFIVYSIEGHRIDKVKVIVNA